MKAPAHIVLWLLQVGMLSGQTPPASVIPDYTQVARDQVPPAFRWKVEAIFENDAAWEKGLDAARATLGTFPKRMKGWTRKPAAMVAFLEAYQALSQDLDRLSAYADLRAATATQEGRFLEMAGKARGLQVSLQQQVASLDDDISAMDAVRLQGFLKAEPRLRPFRVLLESAQRRGRHTLSGDARRVLLETQRFSGGSRDAAMTLQNALLPPPVTQLADGSKVALQGPALGRLLRSANPQERRAAAEGLAAASRPLGPALAALLDTCVKKNHFEAKVQRHADCLSAELYPYNVDPALIRALLKNIKTHLAPYHAYLETRKRLLGLSELHGYDNYLLARPDIRLRFTYEEARDTLQAATGRLGPDYAAQLARAFQEGWIDVYGHQGKPGLGSLVHVPGVHPFALLNYRGTYFDFITVAHELGHGMHYVLAEQHRPWAEATPPWLLTEIPSTLNEILVTRQRLDHEADPKARMALLEALLARLDTLLVFSTRVAELELDMHAHVEQGGTLTESWLNQRYLEIARHYSGHAQGTQLVDDHEAGGWNYPNTFFDTFRGYKVSLATLAALALAEPILRGDAPTIARYNAFLRAGASKPGLESLKEAGVDLADPDTARRAMSMFHSLAQEWSQLAKSIP